MTDAEKTGKKMARRDGSGTTGRKRHGFVADMGIFAVKFVVFGGAIAVTLGFIVESCSSIPDASSGDGTGTGDGGPVVVVAAEETTSELRAELYSQALDAEGYKVERSYGHEGWERTRSALSKSDGAFVFPVLAYGSEPDGIPVSGATMLAPTGEAIGGRYPAPLAGDDWARRSSAGVRALNETTEALEPDEYARLLEAIEDGAPVGALVAAWRRSEDLPPAPDVHPAEPVEEEGEKA